MPGIDKSQYLNELLQRSVTRQPPVAERELPPVDPGLAALNAQNGNNVNPGEYQRRNATYVNQGQSALVDAMNRRQQSDRTALQKLQERMAQQVQKSINVNIGPGEIHIPTATGQRKSGGNPNFPTGNFGAFMKAISAQESGGNYGAINRDSGAMGKYQIMPGNIRGSKRGWDYEALGRDVSTSEFINNPQLQEQIAQYKMQQYYKKWGPRGAAIAWYAGPGAVNYKNLNKSQGKYPSISGYVDSILRRLGL